MTPGNPESLVGDLSEVARFADDYVESLRRGQPKSLTEWAVEFPNLNDELPRLARTLDAIEIKDAPNDRADIPKNIDEYRIVREIGRGGMGVVYEAVQESLGRRVAIKLLPLFAMMGERMIERFQREAKAAGRLHHQNIVPVHSAGRHEGMPYYVMQLIDGPSLEDVLAVARKPQRPTDSTATPDASTVLSIASDSSLLGTSAQSEARTRAAARIALEAAEALAYAHGQGVLHRDVKPANLLIDSTGNAWLTDFGLAQVNDDAGLTGTGDVAGTLRYLAPERLWGACGPPSDVYGLGLVLYEMICGTPAFPQRERAELLRAVESWDPPKPSFHATGVPRDLETIVLTATSKDPSKRYTTAGALAADLRNFLEHKPIRAQRRTWRDHLAKWCRRNPWLAVMTATAFGFLIAGGTTSTALWLRAEEKRIEAENSGKAAENRRVIADNALLQAGVERTKAVERLQLLRNLLDGIAEKVTFMPGNAVVRAKAIGEAIDAYRNHLPEAQEDADVWSDLVRLYQRKCLVDIERFEVGNAATAIASAYGLLDDPQCPMPELSRLRERCICQRLECFVHRFAGNDATYSNAIDAFGTSVDRLKAVDTAPEYVRNLEGMHSFELGSLLSRRGEYVEAIASFRQALEAFQTPTPDEPLAHYATNRVTFATTGLAYAQLQSGDRAGAKRTYVELFAALANRAGELDRVERSELAFAHFSLGAMGPPEVPTQERMQHYETSAQLYNALRREYGEAPYWGVNIALLALRRANTTMPGVSLSVAELALLEGMDAIRATRSAFPTVPGLEQREMDLSSRLGDVLVQRNDFHRARGYLESAVAVRRERLKTTPDHSGNHHQQAVDLLNLSRSRWELDHDADSLPLVSEAIDLERRALDLNPKSAVGKRLLARAHFEMASQCLGLARVEEAATHVGLMHQTLPDVLYSKRAATKFAYWCNRNLDHPLRGRMRSAALEQLRYWVQSSKTPPDAVRSLLDDKEFRLLLGVASPEQVFAELKLESPAKK